jgi:hypothetical protein
LNAAEQSIVWWGRYPSPFYADDLISQSADRLFSTPDLRYPADHLDACKLYDRLEALLKPRALFSIKKTRFGNTVTVGLMPGDDSGHRRS